MSDWIVCSHCNLKHRQRANGACPRCGGPVGDPAGTGGDMQMAGGFAEQPAWGAPPAAVQQPAEKPREEMPWYTVFVGLGFLGFAWYLHVVFNEFATGQRQSVRLPSILILVIDIFGPTITIGLMVLFGLFVTWIGVRRLLR